MLRAPLQFILILLGLVGYYDAKVSSMELVRVNNKLEFDMVNELNGDLNIQSRSPDVTKVSSAVIKVIEKTTSYPPMFLTSDGFLQTNKSMENGLTNIGDEKKMELNKNKTIDSNLIDNPSEGTSAGGKLEKHEESSTDSVVLSTSNATRNNLEDISNTTRQNEISSDVFSTPITTLITKVQSMSSETPIMNKKPFIQDSAFMLTTHATVTAETIKSSTTQYVPEISTNIDNNNLEKTTTKKLNLVFTTSADSTTELIRKNENTINTNSVTRAIDGLNDVNSVRRLRKALKSENTAPTIMVEQGTYVTTEKIEAVSQSMTSTTMHENNYKIKSSISISSAPHDMTTDLAPTTISNLIQSTTTSMVKETINQNQNEIGTTPSFTTIAVVENMAAAAPVANDDDDDNKINNKNTIIGNSIPLTESTPFSSTTTAVESTPHHAPSEGVKKKDSGSNILTSSITLLLPILIFIFIQMV